MFKINCSVSGNFHGAPHPLLYEGDWVLVIANTIDLNAKYIHLVSQMNECMIFFSFYIAFCLTFVNISFEAPFFSSPICELSKFAESSAVSRGILTQV